MQLRLPHFVTLWGQELRQPDLEDHSAFSHAKASFIREVMGRADRWSQEVGWGPGPSDA